MNTENLYPLNKADIVKEKNNADMVSSFNSLLEAASDNKSDRRTNTLYNQLTGLSKTYEASLGRIGISVSKDGSLTIDEEKLKKSSEINNSSTTSDLEKFFKSNGNGTNYGFSNRLSTLAKNVSSNPTNYVSIGGSAKTPQFSTSQVSNYNRYMNASFLFDMMI